MKLDNVSYRDKIVSEYFSKYSDNATIQGVVPSTHFRKNKNEEDVFVGRIKNLTTGQYKKINNDTQHPGRCYEFDDAQYIISSSPSDTFINLIDDNDWSVSFSIKTTSQGSLEDIMSNGSGQAQNCYISIGTGHLTLSIYHQSSTLTRVVSDIDISDGAWHDIIMSYKESTNQGSIYIDGVESTYSTNTIGTGDVNFSGGGSGVWAIGRFNAVGNVSRNFNGKLRGIRFFDRLVFGEDVYDYRTNSVATLTGEDSSVNLYDLDEGATWVANLSSVLVEDEQVNYSWLNEKGYTVNGSSVVVPADPKDLTLDMDGNLLQFKGKLASRAQLVNAPCLVLNGTDQKIQLSYEPSSIKINDVDVTLDFTIVDLGGGDWTIEPSVSTQIYNLVINDTYYYPCSEKDGAKIYDISGNDTDATIVNAILPDLWGTQDIYHYSFYSGYWEYTDISDNVFYCPVDTGATVDISAVTFTRQGYIKGFEITGKYNGASDIQFPNIPEIPVSLRGLSFTYSELVSEASTNDNLEIISDGTILIINEALSTIEKQRI